MATITIRRLDDTTVTKLKERAATKGTSMEQEAREILTREIGRDRDHVIRSLRAFRASVFGDRVLPDGAPDIRTMRDERTEWLDRRNGDVDS